MRSSAERLSWCVTFVLVFLCVASPTVVSAVRDKSTTVAAPVEVVGEVRDGDIVSYDPITETYGASKAWSDPTMFGIVVDDPVLYMEDDGLATTSRPVVRYGEARVNVTDLNGDILPGDLVTTSHIVGTGQRMSREVGGFVVGFALDTVSYEEAIELLEIDGMPVRIGSVPIALRIGYIQVENNDDSAEEYALMLASTTELMNGIEEQHSEEGSGDFDLFLLIRYLLGSFVAITAVVLALRRFGDLFAQSVISIGRNPLARSQIRSILVWNAVLIVIVSGVGLGIGIAIIVL